MDTLAHALYGATFFSRSGFAGGPQGLGQPGYGRVFTDWTVWAALGFGVLPDAFSIGSFFLLALIQRRPIGFHAIPAYVFCLYKCSHSLAIAACGVLAIGIICRPLFVPALAWILHIVMDTVTHGAGRFQTPVFYPFSDFVINGVNFWMHRELVVFYWSLLPLLWLGLYFWRRSKRG